MQLVYSKPPSSHGPGFKPPERRKGSVANAAGSRATPDPGLSPDTTARNQVLSLEQPEASAEALLDCTAPADLATWSQAN